MDELESMSFPSQKLRAMIFQLYKELKYLRNFTDLIVHKVEELNLMYVTGKFEEKQEIFLPIAADETVTPYVLTLLQNHLQKNHQTTGLTMALMESDSTTVFFNITPGFIAPPDSTATDSDDIMDEHVSQDQQSGNTTQNTDF